MLKVVKRAWRYLVAALSGRLDELADPRVEIEQAIQEAKEHHRRLTQQAAAVIGNEREIELKYGRAVEQAERLQASARQALRLAGQDPAKAREYEESAQVFATRLVAAEAVLRDLQAAHQRARQASAQARTAVENNAMALRQKAAERMRLLNQLDQAKMQERLNQIMSEMSGLAPQGETPTLEQVRDKIEKRYARALGEGELASGSVEARMIEVERATVDAEAAARLEAIRAGLNDPDGLPGLPGEKRRGERELPG
ncbi:PspA/IM30 family protein [Nonomuraea typhae]|uniref:PspA/IM30 family protein n=1 Tax=Nonomuraea typhae TaxID=2603600 RepID=A0ABW7Z2N4_9ACTN